MRNMVRGEVMIREWRTKAKGLGYRRAFVRTGISQPTQNKPLTLCW